MPRSKNDNLFTPYVTSLALKLMEEMAARPCSKPFIDFFPGLEITNFKNIEIISISIIMQRLRTNDYFKVSEWAHDMKQIQVNCINLFGPNDLTTILANQLYSIFEKKFDLFACYSKAKWTKIVGILSHKISFKMKQLMPQSIQVSTSIGSTLTQNYPYIYIPSDIPSDLDIIKDVYNSNQTENEPQISTTSQIHHISPPIHNSPLNQYKNNSPFGQIKNNSPPIHNSPLNQFKNNSPLGQTKNNSPSRHNSPSNQFRNNSPLGQIKTNSPSRHNSPSNQLRNNSPSSQFGNDFNHGLGGNIDLSDSDIIMLSPDKDDEKGTVRFERRKTAETHSRSRKFVDDSDDRFELKTSNDSSQNFVSEETISINEAVAMGNNGIDHKVGNFDANPTKSGQNNRKNKNSEKRERVISNFLTAFSKLNTKEDAVNVAQIIRTSQPDIELVGQNPRIDFKELNKDTVKKLMRYTKMRLTTPK